MLIPLQIRQAYALAADEAELEVQHVPSNINRTYVVRDRRHPSREPLVLQRLHPVFGPNVHIDIEAVTNHLLRRGLETPRLVHNAKGELWTLDAEGAEAGVWRALSYVDGVTLHQSQGPRWLESAASLLATFHRALTDLEHEFVHERPLHDTARHLANLEAALASDAAAHDAAAQELGASVLRQAEGVRLDFGALPRRTIHGDPKLSNVMFHRQPEGRARCMIDLDTVGRGHLAYELGDALRSWCNPAGEDTASPRVDVAAFAATLSGYTRACPDGVSSAELLSAIDGLETVSLELASRFAADVINDRYWGWDATRFPSRRAHNELRARGQLELSRAVRAQRGQLVGIAERALHSSLGG